MIFETGTSKPSTSIVQKLKVMQAISPGSTSTSNTAGQHEPQRSSPTSFHSRREVSAVRHHTIDTVMQQPKVRRLGGPSRRAHTRRPVSGNASGLGSGPVRRSRSNSLQDTEQGVAKNQDSSHTSTKPTYFEKYDTISKNHKKEKRQELQQEHQEKGNTEEERRRRQVVEKEEVHTKEDRATIAKRHRSNSSTQGGSTTTTDSNTATTLSSLLEHLRGSNAGKSKIEK